jgi:hypothetical protein
MTQVSIQRETFSQSTPMSVQWLLSGRAEKFCTLIIIALITFLVRLPEFGNPAPDFDEQLYFLAGERMWQGLVPFVDIWDRKPIGLFLIYAATHVFGDNGIIQYQIVAALFAAVTAWLIFCIGRRTTSFVGALCAAGIYIVYLRVLLSAVGQSETFFMLFCVASMYLAVRAIETDNPTRIRKIAMGTMLALGIALQIKYTIVFQCIFFGLFFLWRSFLATRSPITVARDAIIFILIGILPTALAAGYYVAIGEWGAFQYANFVSVFDRGPLTGGIALYCVVYSAVAIAPLLGIALYQLYHDQKLSGNPKLITLMIVAWAFSGIAAVFLTSSVYIYYFIPLIPTLAILTGNFIGGANQRWAIIPALLIYAGYVSDYPGAFQKSHKDTAAISKITALLNAHDTADCIYVYDGPTILYSTTKSCLPTAYAYPDHLSNLQEKYSIGIDQAAEVKRVLAARPAAIVTANRPVVPKLSKRPRTLVNNAIRENYRFAGRELYDRRMISVFIRNDLMLNSPSVRTQ